MNESSSPSSQDPFYQMVLCDSPESILSVLVQPLNIIEKSCVVYRPTSRLAAFEGKLIHHLELNLWELNYHSHGVGRLGDLVPYLTPLKIVWGRGTSSVLGQSSPYQNLMELVRVNILNHSNFPLDLIYKLSPQKFDKEFFSLLDMLAHSYFFETDARAEIKLEKFLGQKKEVSRFLARFIKWFRSLEKTPEIFSQIFMWEILNSDFYRLRPSEYSALDILKLISPYYYLDRDRLAVDLLGDLEQLGASCHQADQFAWESDAHKVVSVAVEQRGKTYQLFAKKYFDASVENRLGRVWDEKSLLWNEKHLMARSFTFRIKEELDTPILWGMPNFASHQIPWSIGGLLFAQGNHIHGHYLVSGSADFWGNEEKLNLPYLQSDKEILESLVTKDMMVWMENLLAFKREQLVLLDQGWRIFVYDHDFRSQLVHSQSKQPRFRAKKNQKLFFREHQLGRESNSLMERLIHVQKQSMVDRFTRP